MPVLVDGLDSPFQMSGLVMELLGEDGLPGFPGPNNELFRDTPVNWLCGLVA